MERAITNGRRVKREYTWGILKFSSGQEGITGMGDRVVRRSGGVFRDASGASEDLYDMLRFLMLHGM